MNGKELYQRLENQHPQLAGCVIFTTGDVMTGDTQNFLSNIDKPFLPKPFAAHELRTIVRESWKEVIL